MQLSSIPMTIWTVLSNSANVAVTFTTRDEARNLKRALKAAGHDAQIQRRYLERWTAPTTVR